MTPSPNGNTAALVAMAKKGDKDAYDRLFGNAADRALAFIRLRLGKKLRDDYDSLDVLQEAYLEAHRAFPEFEFKNDGSFGRWLCVIVENKIRGLADHAGALKRRPKGEREHLSGVIERAHSVAGPATVASRAERFEALGRALDRLEEADRHVLLLRYFADMTLEEVAAATGNSETTTRRMIAQATVKLGGMLGALRED